MQGEKPKHSRFCKMVKDNTSVTDPFKECLFLYREFETEALRLLIPATTMDATNVRVESFVAAFMLGMKKKFGNVDHLRATISEVPVPEADYRKQYLVIYDSVPGGTGYLKQLMNEENGIIDVFEGALETIGYLDHLQVMSTGMIFLLWVIHIREYIEIRQYFQNAELMSAEEAAT